jgi:bifunctional enzyme CysN/CysC
VQYVTRPDLHFRGYMGTPASGIVRPGDEVVALPSGVRSRVMRVIGAGGDVAEAFPPMAVTLTLADDIDVSRGDVLVRPNNVPRVSNTFESMLVWMAADAMRPGRQYVVKHGTRKVPAFIKSIRYRVDVNTLHRHAAGELGLNEIGRCELELARPIAFDAYLKNRASGSFIVIDRETHNTVGAGMILDRERIEPSRDATTATMPAASRATDRGASLVTASERRERLRQTAFVVVLTGDDAAATVAYAVERELFNAGLIGHVVRTGDAAKLLCDAGLVAICVADGDGRVGQSIDADRVLEVTAAELAAAPAQIMNQLRARGWA